MYRTQPSLAVDLPMPRAAHDCPVENWLTFFGHRWNALVLWHLAPGAKRHGELMTALPGVTAKVLSERLVGLERHRLVSRSVANTFPRTVRYSLTARGHELVGIFNQIELWSKAVAADVIAEDNVAASRVPG
jgi:DNA-binding HxlR family transcriptional regulator